MCALLHLHIQDSHTWRSKQFIPGVYLGLAYAWHPVPGHRDEIRARRARPDVCASLALQESASGKAGLLFRRLTGGTASRTLIFQTWARRRSSLHENKSHHSTNVNPQHEAVSSRTLHCVGAQRTPFRPAGEAGAQGPTR